MATRICRINTREERSTETESWRPEKCLLSINLYKHIRKTLEVGGGKTRKKKAEKSPSTDRGTKFLFPPAREEKLLTYGPLERIPERYLLPY